MPGRFKLPLWLLPVFIAALVALFGWWGNERLRDTIEGGLRTQLSTTLNANVTALGIWATNQTRIATVLADDPAVRHLAEKVLQSPPRREFRVAPLPEFEQFVSDMRPRLNQLGYDVAQLVTTNFQVVANSTRPQPLINMMVSEAHTNKFAQLFASGEPVLITPFKPELLTQRRIAREALALARTNVFRRFNRATVTTGRQRRGDATLMQVAAPVRDDERGIIGALALIINPDKEFSRILSVARSGKSGETYAFDQTGLMISRSRFDEQLKQMGLLAETNDTSALNLRLSDPGADLTKGSQRAINGHPLTHLVASALDGENVVDVTPAPDYRGVPVVGASRWLPQFGFGVATQIDADEAYRPLRVLQLVFVILVLFLLLCATGMFVFSRANRAWQLRLTEAELKLKQLGQYTLEEKIGEGGMGVVYRARHALLRSDTAVKLLLPSHATPVEVERFEREVCLTCQLAHPNTIQIFDYGHTPEGIFYYAMEFLRGVNLHDLVMRFGPQPEARVISILSQICDSLAEAHAVGLIHRDIKPGNVFLCRRGGVADYVKVLDFGLVRDYRDGLPAPVAACNGETAIEGTLWFMPPEAISGVPVDPRSDLYSLGALGYFLLTGHFIFDAATIAEIQEKQLSTPPVPPSLRTSQSISAGMEQLLMRCLEKDRERRPQSALELKTLLLGTPHAAEWTPQLSHAWWDTYEQQRASGETGIASADSTTLPTVHIDLASRME